MIIYNNNTTLNQWGVAIGIDSSLRNVNIELAAGVHSPYNYLSILLFRYDNSSFNATISANLTAGDKINNSLSPVSLMNQGDCIEIVCDGDFTGSYANLIIKSVASLSLTQIANLVSGENGQVLISGEDSTPNWITPAYAVSYNNATNVSTALQTINGTGVSNWKTLLSSGQLITINGNSFTNNNFTINTTNFSCNVAGIYKIDAKFTINVAGTQSTFIQLVLNGSTVITASACSTNSLLGSQIIAVSLTHVANMSSGNTIDFRITSSINGLNLNITGYAINIIQVI